MSTPVIVLSVYIAGMFVAAFVAGFCRVRLGDMPVGVFASMWPFILVIWAYDALMTQVARLGVRIRGDEES